MQRLDLNGTWSLTDVNTAASYPARVPGSNYADLLRAGAIPDPFTGTNEAQTHWVGEHDWRFSRTFTLPDEVLACPMVELVAERLDTLADVMLNGTRVLQANNMHRVWRADLKQALVPGENKLEITFASPVQYLSQKQKEDRMPFNSNGLDGIPHIRKAQCHFGWDWGPIIPVSGITKPIYIEYGSARITSFTVRQQHAEDGQVTLQLSCDRLGEAERVRFRVHTPQGGCLEAEAACGAPVSVDVPDPLLWWSCDLSDAPMQPLYRVEATLCGRGGAVLDRMEKEVGLRTIRLDRSPDERGSRFTFVLNGTPVFARGANWIPADALPDRVDEEKQRFLLQSMRDSGQNMVRVWGGGTYEDESFYRICDRLGILVWQDCAFACQPYPFYDPDFLANVQAEIGENLARLEHHASLALWCGNNEIEAMTGGWLAMRRLVEAQRTFFWETLPGWMAQWAPHVPFVPGTPVGTSYLHDVSSDAHGDTHLWQVWHGLKPLTFYRTRTTRFCSEFGLESLPDIRTVRAFGGEEGEQSLSSPVFRAHQKCSSGNNKMLFYTMTRFRLPKKMEDLVYLTQIVQEECVRDATEHFRRNRAQCAGALYWQLNDCWPVSSWSSIDYYGRWKVLQYRAKDWSAPTTLSVEEGKTGARVWLLHDGRAPFRGRAEVRVIDFAGTDCIAPVALQVEGAPTSSTPLCYISLPKNRKWVRKNGVLVATLWDETGREVARRTALFAPERDLALPDPELRFTATPDGDAVRICVQATRFARYVRVQSPYGCLPYSDQAFDLLPGEQKEVRAPLPQGVTAEQYVAALQVGSVYGVAPALSPLSERLMKLRIRLKPLNIANALVYTFQ